MTWDNKMFLKIRKQLGYNQSQAAAWLETCQKTISNWEAGSFEPRQATLISIAEKITSAFDASIAEQVTGIGERDLDHAKKPRQQYVILVLYHDGTREVFLQNMQTLKYIVDNFDLIKKMITTKLHN